MVDFAFLLLFTQHQADRRRGWWMRRRRGSKCDWTTYNQRGRNSSVKIPWLLRLCLNCIIRRRKLIRRAVLPLSESRELGKVSASKWAREKIIHSIRLSSDNFVDCIKWNFLATILSAAILIGAVWACLCTSVISKDPWKLFYLLINIWKMSERWTEYRSYAKLEWNVRCTDSASECRNDVTLTC